MQEHSAVNSGRGRRRGLCALLTLAALASGCQAPPAYYAGDKPCDLDLPRPVLLVRQMTADSAVELAYHPLRTGAAALAETADTAAAVGEGVVCKRVLLPLRGEAGPIDSARPTLDPATLEAELKRLTHRDLQPAQLDFSEDGQEALASLLRLIDGASTRIDLMMFLWGNDAVGWAVANHLAARAAAGVPVRVLVDGGNVVYPERRGLTAEQVNRTVCWLARQPNVCVLRTRDGWARFDHRKLVVVDGQAAWTGGRNFRKEEFAQEHDLSFILTGPLADDLAEEFERFWQEQGGQAVVGCAANNRQLTTDNCSARVVATGPLRHDLADVIFAAIDHAKHHIYVENPYLSDSRLLLRLVRARRRGVDVRVVLPLDTSPAIIGRANRVTANYLLRAGVRVYLYDGKTHVKALSVDGAWAYAGTGNFDPLSLRHDYELGVALSAGPAVHEIEEGLLVPDLRPEWELKGPLPLTVHDCLSEIIASLFG
jgi:phosphatidylserine/phosphatidylglycerophosphate/cardiolipin synthase-like enzyme